jgi:carboxyl-terminal processing protease
MKYIWKILSYVLVAAVAAVTAVVCCLVAQRSNVSKLDELQLLLEQCYVGEAKQEALENAAASAMVKALGDEWSYYMTAEEYAIHQEAMSNSYVGVGITVQNRDDLQGIDVVEVTKGSPAMEAGVQAGDVVIKVDDASLLGGTVNDAGRMIRGEEGTPVTLTVVRDGKTLTFTMPRKKLITEVATYQMLEGNIGLITIENFDDRCAEETIRAIDTLLDQGAKALIFDVRNNPGGYAHELVEVLDHLLPEGEIFHTVDYRGKEKVERSDADCVDVPMAVLMNLRSYSAAEFFAAALDEYDAAITVGEKTYGKGYFQTTIPLSDGSAVNLSIGKYYTPEGKSLAGVGLTPDVEVTVDKETAQAILAGNLVPEEDPQIRAAIKALGD